MTQELRKVEFNCIIDNGNSWTNLRLKEGYFHTWGEAIIEEKQLTVAIVEDLTGKVFRVPPEALQFK